MWKKHDFEVLEIAIFVKIIDRTSYETQKRIDIGCSFSVSNEHNGAGYG